MKSYESIVKERMKQQVDLKLTGGLFQGKPYNHIFQKLEYNFIDGKYPVFKRMKGTLPDSNIKYHYANHLNSSQAMCIGYFKKFFEKESYELLLAEILMMLKLDISRTEFSDAIFEYEPDPKEKTNFDFYLKLSDGRSISWEIKFTESEFGGTIKTKSHIDKYIDKWTDVYIPMLNECAYYDHPTVFCDNYQCLETGVLTNDCSVYNQCSIYEFYKYYQIRRNITYAKNKGDYVLFLTPRENKALDDGRIYIEDYATKWKTNNIRNIYWEDLLDITLQVVVCDKQLYEYYKTFKEKYFG